MAVYLLALLVRVGAAIALDVWLASRGERFIFGDSESYFDLAEDILLGRPYEVYTRPAFRSPGYPAFLSVAMWVGGARTLTVRLAQALVGALVPVLVYVLASRWVHARTALLAGLLCAVYPYFVGINTLILSESIFPVLVLGVMVGLAGLAERRRTWLAAGTGVLCGATTLVRPSVMLFLLFWGLASLVLGRHRRAVAANLAVATAALALTLVPWTVRNWYATGGHFVPTATTFGVTLYDGLSPTATGASDQSFTTEPRWHGIPSIELDRRWARLALQWAWHNPLRTLELAAVKFRRFWSPWPNAAELDRWWIALASAMFVVPVFVLVLLGTFVHTRNGRANGTPDWRVRLFLLGPLLYFCGLHMVVVSSIRYRVPAMAPAFILAAVGLRWLAARGSRKGESSSEGSCSAGPQADL